MDSLEWLFSESGEEGGWIGHGSQEEACAFDDSELQDLANIMGVDWDTCLEELPGIDGDQWLFGSAEACEAGDSAGAEALNNSSSSSQATEATFQYNSFIKQEFAQTPTPYEGIRQRETADCKSASRKRSADQDGLGYAQKPFCKNQNTAKALFVPTDSNDAPGSTRPANSSKPAKKSRLGPVKKEVTELPDLKGLPPKPERPEKVVASPALDSSWATPSLLSHLQSPQPLCSLSGELRPFSVVKRTGLEPVLTLQQLNDKIHAFSSAKGTTSTSTPGHRPGISVNKVQITGAAYPT